jgi:hypothetical protein
MLMKFRAGFAILAFVVAMIIIMIAMMSSTAQASEYTGTIIGFITGSLVTLILSFYFGSSEGSDQTPGAKPPISAEPGNNPVKTRSKPIAFDELGMPYDVELPETDDFVEGDDLDDPKIK